MIFLSIVLQQLLISLHFVVDNLFSSRLGAAIGAVGSAHKFMMIIRTIIVAASAVGAAFVAQCYGKKDSVGIKSFFLSNLFFNLTLATIFVSIYMVTKSSLTESLISERALRVMLVEYLDVLIFSSLSFAIFAAFISLLRNIDRSREAMILSLTALLVNYLLDLLFFTTLRGFAFSTILAEVLAVVVAIYLTRKTFVSEMSWDLIKYLKVSIPFVISALLNALSLLLAHNLISRLGRRELIAFGIVSPIESILLDLFIGVGMVSITVVAPMLAKSNFDKAYEKTKSILLYSSALSIVLGLILALAYGSSLMLILALFLIFKAFHTSLSNGVLSAGGDSFFVMLTTIFVDWAVTLPLIYIGYWLYNWSIFHIYLAMNIGDMITATLFFFRLRSKKWMNNLV